MYSFTISCFSAYPCVELEYRAISASGRLNPVLRLDFEASAMGAAKSVFTNDLWIEIRHQDELIGHGKFPPTTFGTANKNQAWVPISVTHRSLDLITNSLSERASSLGLDIKFTGSILMEENIGYPLITSLQQMIKQMPKLGEFYVIPMTEHSSTQLTLERSTWYSSVLAELRI